MKKILLTLLLAVAFVSLCPSVAHATQTIAGTVYVGTLTDTRIALNGDVTLVVNQDYYLREISGTNYKLTLVLNGDYTLTVDQDKKSTASIDVASLEIRGTGNLLSTGRNYGAFIRGGELKIDNYTGTAAFHGRDGDWAHGIWLKDGVTVNILSGTVEFETTDGYGIGGNGQVNISGSNTVVNISSDQDGINLEAAGNNGNITMNGGTLNVYGQREALHCIVLTMNSGSRLYANNSDSYDAVHTTSFYANNCYVNVVSEGDGISTAALKTQDAFIAAYGGYKCYGIYARKAPAGSNGQDGFLWFQGYSNNSVIIAEGDYGGLYSADFIIFENNYVYAKARRSGNYAVEAKGNLVFNLKPYCTYTAVSSGCPFYAVGEIRMYQPFNDRYDQFYNTMINTSRYSISSDKHNFVTYAGSGPSNNTTATPGQIIIASSNLSDAGVNMDETLQAEYNGYYQTRPVAAYKGERVKYVEPPLLTDYVLHNPTNNSISQYPYPTAPVRTVEWYRVNNSGNMTKVGTGDTYTLTAADVGNKIKALVSYSSHKGAVYSNELPVVVKQNNNEPNRPTLQISTPSGSSTRYVYVSAYPTQEYIVMTTPKAVDALTEADWANAMSRSSIGLLQLCQANYDQVYYVYTRFKETATHAPGTQVLYSSISGGTSVNYTGISMTATPMNGATLIPDDHGYCCLKNTVVKLTLSPVPSNATNFNGVLGSGMSISKPTGSTGTSWDNECGTLYADAACTQSLVSGQYYTTVYAKLKANRDNDVFGNANIRAYLAGFTSDLYFQVANEDGTWDLWGLNMRAYYTFHVTKGCSVTETIVPIPAMADISNVTVEYARYTGSLSNPIPPTVTVNTQAKTFTVSTYDATADDNGYYTFYFMDGDRNLAYTNIYVDKRPVEGVIITPEEVTLDPVVGQLQLQAAIYPEYAEGDVVWTSSKPNYLSVDENGLVTLTNLSNTLGETYYITAQVEDFIDTCVVHVGGEKYDLVVGGTRVTSLNKFDILGHGEAYYDNGTLYLNGGTVGTATFTNPSIISDMKTLIIKVLQQTRVQSNCTSATIYSTGRVVFDGTGTLLVSNRNGSPQSAGLAARDIVVRDGANVDVTCRNFGTTAANGVSVIGTGVLTSNGTNVSLRAKNYLSGYITEPAGAFWQSNRGYVVLNGITVADQDVVVTGIPIEPSFIRGDVNGDGNVNISDVTALINYLLSHDATGINLDAANCNEDSTVNISDVTALINYLLSHSW